MASISMWPTRPSSLTQGGEACSPEPVLKHGTIHGRVHPQKHGSANPPTLLILSVWRSHPKRTGSRATEVPHTSRSPTVPRNAGLDTLRSGASWSRLGLALDDGSVPSAGGWDAVEAALRESGVTAYAQVLCTAARHRRIERHAVTLAVGPGALCTALGQG